MTRCGRRRRRDGVLLRAARAEIVPAPSPRAATSAAAELDLAAAGSRVERRTRTPAREPSLVQSSIPPVLVGEAPGSLVAADRTTAMPVTAARGCQRNHQDLAGDFATHQPMCRRYRRIEQWIAGPHFQNVVDPQVGMLEQMCGLRVDLERVMIIELIHVETLRRHSAIVIHTNTNFPRMHRREGEAIRS